MRGEAFQLLMKLNEDIQSIQIMSQCDKHIETASKTLHKAQDNYVFTVNIMVDMLV